MCLYTHIQFSIELSYLSRSDVNVWKPKTHQLASFIWNNILAKNGTRKNVYDKLPDELTL